jgi:hypothetical protein
MAAHVGRTPLPLLRKGLSPCVSWLFTLTLYRLFTSLKIASTESIGNYFSLRCLIPRQTCRSVSRPSQQSRRWAAKSFFASKLHQDVGPTLTTPPIFTFIGILTTILRYPVKQRRDCAEQRPICGVLGKQNLRARASIRTMETPCIRHSTVNRGPWGCSPWADISPLGIIKGGETSRG